jgi:hypothetical protein
LLITSPTITCIYQTYILPPVNYKGGFCYTPPYYHPPYPLPYIPGGYPPSLPSSFFLVYGGIIPSAMYSQKNSGKNFWEKNPPFLGLPGIVKKILGKI